MEGSRDYRAFVLAAVVFCLLGALHAQGGTVAVHANASGSHTFVVPLASQCSKTHKAEVSVAYPAAKSVRETGWDVSVAVDTTECKLYCTFHRKHNSSLPDSWMTGALPPVATIYLYQAMGPEAAILLLDPAGLEFPDVRAYETKAPTVEVSTPRRQFAEMRVEWHEPPVALYSSHYYSLPQDFDRPVSAAVPLRI